MTTDRRVLALIPARKGSERLKNKNTLEIGGMTLVEIAIQSALRSSLVHSVVVSTDDEEIRNQAIATGAYAPFLRPEGLSGSRTGSVEVVIHAINFLAKEGEEFSHILLLQPTSPLRTTAHIDGIIDQFFASGAQSAISVCKQEHPWTWSFRFAEGMIIESAFKDFEVGSRSQDSEYLYSPNGALYLTSIDLMLSQKTFFPTRGLTGFEMERQASVDIDSLEDLEIAAALAQFNGLIPSAND